jgi:xanthine dehydrogenase YagS FAD-binding subunit
MFALASVAAQIDFDGDVVIRAQIVLGGVAPKPWRVLEAEAILQNEQLDDFTINRTVETITASSQPLQYNRYKIALIK